MSAVALISYIIQAYSWVIIARVIMSWFIMNSRNETVISIYQVLVQITEPFLAPLRRIVPRVGMIDITPMVAILVLWMIDAILWRFV
ncbi:MAG TPA: YggT family protein [Dehalococcoidia bacterium]|nr:YggT family protein [Dehalococcoidia bacterium]